MAGTGAAADVPKLPEAELRQLCDGVAGAGLQGKQCHRLHHPANTGENLVRGSQASRGRIMMHVYIHWFPVCCQMKKYFDERGI